jgi:hypothetical protein
MEIMLCIPMDEGERGRDAMDPAIPLWVPGNVEWAGSDWNQALNSCVGVWTGLG